jgi:hypothetical protein
MFFKISTPLKVTETSVSWASAVLIEIENIRWIRLQLNRLIRNNQLNSFRWAYLNFIIYPFQVHYLAIHFPLCNGGWMEDEWRMNGGWMEDQWRMNGRTALALRLKFEPWIWVSSPIEPWVSAFGTKFSTIVNNSIKKRLPSFGYICPFRRFWCMICRLWRVLPAGRAEYLGKKISLNSFSLFYVLLTECSGMVRHGWILIFVGKAAESETQNIELRTQNTEKTYPYKHG